MIVTVKTIGVALGLWIAALSSAAALDCNAQDVNQAELNQCSQEAFRKADALLNTRYRTILGCLKDRAKPLVEAQRAWIKFRDSECAFQGSATEGGSFQPTAINNCMTSVTEARAKALDYYLTCEEGDLSCPTVDCGFGKRK